MGTLKLLSSEFNEIDFQLLAIHCPIEGYRLAFFINKFLKINLTFSKNKLHVLQKKGSSYFERFSFEDVKKDIRWDLIENKNTINKTDNSEVDDLFSETLTNFSLPVFLIPEFKKVDFFLRIDCESNAITSKELIAEIKKIQFITTVYEVNTDKIKSKSNLIF